MKGLFALKPQESSRTENILPRRPENQLSEESGYDKRLAGRICFSRLNNPRKITNGSLSITRLNPSILPAIFDPVSAIHSKKTLSLIFEYI